MLREDAQDIRDATTLGHPLFAVKAIFVARLLRLVHENNIPPFQKENLELGPILKKNLNRKFATL
jgi:hypothetical protein